MDKIFIEHLALRGKHGVLDEERSRDQEFIVDISIGFDTQRAATSDTLIDTVDYNHFRDGARSIVEGKSFRLLEKLADAIAIKVLEDSRIDEVRVTVRKTEMFPDSIPGVTIVRTRK